MGVSWRRKSNESKRSLRRRRKLSLNVTRLDYALRKSFSISKKIRNA